MEKTGRNLSLDLLRIICMLMVVCLHFFSHGGLSDAMLPSSFNWFAGNTLLAACLVAVNCFVIISGYHLCTTQFKLQKLVSVWLQAFLYSIFCCIIVSLLTDSFSIKELIKSFMVMTMKQYWFVTAYLLLYIVSPVLNCAIRAMSKKMHLLCCVVLLAVFSVAHNIVYISDFGGVNGGYSFLWFCVLYIVAAYLRFHVAPNQFGWKRPLLLYLICVALIAGERFVAYYITPFIFGRVVLTSLFYSYNSIFMALASFSLFQSFRAFTINNKKFRACISLFAPLSFAVYLLHDNRFARPILWNVLNPTQYKESWKMIPYVIASAIAIFLICIIIEFIRFKVFQVFRISSTINKICNHSQLKIQHWLNK